VPCGYFNLQKKHLFAAACPNISRLFTKFAVGSTPMPICFSFDQPGLKGRNNTSVFAAKGLVHWVMGGVLLQTETGIGTLRKSALHLGEANFCAKPLLP